MDSLYYGHSYYNSLTANTASMEAKNALEPEIKASQPFWVFNWIQNYIGSSM